MNQIWVFLFFESTKFYTEKVFLVEIETKTHKKAKRTVGYSNICVENRGTDLPSVQSDNLLANIKASTLRLET